MNTFTFSMGGINNRFEPRKTVDFTNEFKRLGINLSNFQLKIINGIYYLAGTIKIESKYETVKNWLLNYFKVYFTDVKLNLNLVSLNSIVNPINVPITKPPTGVSAGANIITAAEVPNIINEINNTDTTKKPSWYDSLSDSLGIGLPVLAVTGVVVAVLVLKK